MKKVLIVEDNPKHLEDAVRILQKAGLDVVTAKDASTGINRMVGDAYTASRPSIPREAWLVDGVITDVFMPQNNQTSGDHDPCGLQVAAVAAKAGIPFVLCTAGYHHTTRYEWINNLCGLTRWTLVDSTTSKTEEAPEKNWAEALEYLIKRAAKPV